MILAPVTEGEVFYIRISSDSAGDDRVNVNLKTKPSKTNDRWLERDARGKGKGLSTEEDLYAQVNQLTVDDYFAAGQTVPRKMTGNAFFVRDAMYDAVLGGDDRRCPFDPAETDLTAKQPGRGKPR